MKIHQWAFENSLRNFSYLIINEESGKAWCIDPWDADEIWNFISRNNLKLEMVINTHSHHDHIKGNQGLIKKSKCSLYDFNFPKIIKIDEETSLVPRKSPGHTEDHLVFFVKRKETIVGVFSGDCILPCGVGNCKNGGNPEVLYETLKSLSKEIPDLAKIYSGHNYYQNNKKFSLGLLKEKDREVDNKKILSFLEEKRENPFLLVFNEKYRKIFFNESLSEKEAFLKLRSLRDQW